MFSNMGKYQPCGIFTRGHFILLASTLVGIFIALKFTVNKNKEQIHKIIKNITITACILETIKIIFNIQQNSLSAVNTYIPLYYCSILMYAGLLSSFAKGVLKRIGDVSLATGAIIGGIVFMIYPSTSLPNYPAFHFLSIHSFLFHGMMVYLGILLNKTKYVELKKEDLKYFAGLIACMGIMAVVINNICGSNLMFISDNFPGNPIEIIYNITNGGFSFTMLMIVLQMTLPFYAIYYTVKLVQDFKNKQKLISQHVAINNDTNAYEVR